MAEVLSGSSFPLIPYNSSHFGCWCTRISCWLPDGFPAVTRIYILVFKRNLASLA